MRFPRSERSTANWKKSSEPSPRMVRLPTITSPLFLNSTNGTFLIWGKVVWDSIRVPLRGSLESQTTRPNHELINVNTFFNRSKFPGSEKSKKNNETAHKKVFWPRFQGKNPKKKSPHSRICWSTNKTIWKSLNILLRYFNKLDRKRALFQQRSKISISKNRGRKRMKTMNNAAKGNREPRAKMERCKRDRHQNVQNSQQKTTKKTQYCILATVARQIEKGLQKPVLSLFDRMSFTSFLISKIFVYSCIPENNLQ